MSESYFWYWSETSQSLYSYMASALTHLDIDCFTHLPRILDHLSTLRHVPFCFRISIIYFSTSNTSSKFVMPRLSQYSCRQSQRCIPLQPVHLEIHCTGFLPLHHTPATCLHTSWLFLRVYFSHLLSAPILPGIPTRTPSPFSAYRYCQNICSQCLWHLKIIDFSRFPAHDTDNKRLKKGLSGNR